MKTINFDDLNSAAQAKVTAAWAIDNWAMAKRHGTGYIIISGSESFERFEYESSGYAQVIRHGGIRSGAGRPPAQEKMRRRSIGMLESDWQKSQTLADNAGVSVDEIIRRLVRAAA